MQLIYVWIVCPLTTVFYGANENETLGKKIFKAIKVQMPMFLSLLLLTVPTYFMLNGVNIPEKEASYYGFESNAEHDGIKVYWKEESFYWHMYLVTLIIGTFFMSIFAGIGMVMLPYDLINEYVYRPKLIDKNAWMKR